MLRYFQGMESDDEDIDNDRSKWSKYKPCIYCIAIFFLCVFIIFIIIVVIIEILTPPFPPYIERLPMGERISWRMIGWSNTVNGLWVCPLTFLFFKINTTSKFNKHAGSIITAYSNNQYLFYFSQLRQLREWGHSPINKTRNRFRKMTSGRISDEDVKANINFKINLNYCICVY